MSKIYPIASRQYSERNPPPQSEQLKEPPHSIESEQRVIGGLMLSNSSWHEISELLTTEDFYRRDHQIIFEAQVEILNSEDEMDVITLSEYLENRGKLDLIGGLAYLGTLAKNTPSAANIRAYAKIVREKALMRRFIQIGTDMASNAFETDGGTASDVFARSFGELTAVSAELEKGHAPTKKEVLYQRIEEIDAKFNGEKEFFYKTHTGLEFSNDGELVVISAVSNMGKSVYANDLAVHLAISNYPDAAPKSVLSIQLEMKKEAMYDRAIASLGNIPFRVIRDGSMEENGQEYWSNLTAAISLLDSAPFEIERIDVNRAQLHAKIEAWASRPENAGGVVVIDQLENIEPMDNSFAEGNDTLRFGRIAKMLKKLAERNAITIILLHQVVQKEIEKRGDMRPRGADLYAGSKVYNAADTVIYLYRDEKYNAETEDKGIAEQIIAKSREMETQTIKCFCDMKTMRFRKLDSFYAGGYGDSEQ